MSFLQSDGIASVLGKGIPPGNSHLNFNPHFGFGVRILLFFVCLFLSTESLATQTVLPDSSQALQFQLRGYEYSKKSANDSSIFFFSKARDLYATVEDWKGFVRCNNFVADNLVRKAEFGNAVSCLNHSLVIAREKFAQENLDLAQSYHLLGYISIYTQEYDSAISYLSRSLRIRTAILGENHTDVGHTVYALGISYRAMGKYDEASSAIYKALTISENCGSKEDAAMNLVALANIFSDKGDYARATSLSTRALAIVRGLGREKSDLMANIYCFLGRDLIKLNRFANAQECLTNSLTITKEIHSENHPSISACYGYLGEIFALRGDYDHAILYYGKALEITVAAYGENHSGLADICENLSDIHSKKHDSPAALKFAENSLRIQSRNYGIGHFLTANSLEKVAHLREAAGQYTDALLYYNKSLAIKSRVAGDGSPIVGQAWLTMGIVYSKANRFDSAQICFDRALYISGKSAAHDKMFAASIQKAIGDLYIRKKEISSSLVHYQEAVSMLTDDSVDSRSGSISREWRSQADVNLLECLTANARALRLLYASSNNIKHLSAAYLEYERAIRLISSIRRSFKAEGSRTFLGEECYSIYTEAVKTALQLYGKTTDFHYKENAFACAERAKANLLNDRMLEADAIRFSGAPESVLEKESSLKAGLLCRETEAAKALKNNDTAKYREARDNYFALTITYGGLLDTIETRFPRYFELKYKDNQVDISHIQSTLDSNTTLLDFFFVDSTLCVFSISKNSFDVTLKTNAALISQTAARLRKSLKTFNEQEYLATAFRLFGMILPPLGRHAIGHHLVIIPDGDLYYIPFEALLTQSPKTNGIVDYRTLPYLLKKYVVSYSYSSTLFAKRENTNHAPATPSFIGFAPVFSDSAENSRIIASNELDGRVSEGMSSLRSISIDGKKYNPLEHSRTEINGIARLFQEHRLKQDVYLYHSASKGSFKELARNYSCVHIASHGYADEEHPDLSGLIFSPPHDTLDADDGILRASETYGLHLDADLVVLSSCESGVGKLVKGEGLVALTRGFFYSGARNIVFSLWKVPDKHTSNLMTAFYASLLSGQDLPMAMRDAKLKMLNDPLSAFPAKWTGFVLLSSSTN
ncbi:MAG: CHAT domain-containing protein [Ignavibacteriales bacterium]|nr:CHAT domain-containing protein [Ignavibacteriales bacterium]